VTGLLAQYLGSGTIANRPDLPDVAPGLTAFYLAEDQGTLYFWVPPADPEPGSWRPANPVLPAPDESGLWAWDADTQGWAAIPAAAVGEAPADGTLYGRKDTAWEAIPDAPDVSGFITDAPEDGTQYARMDGAWVEVESGGGDASYPDFVGNAGKVLAVNAEEDGVEWVDGGLAGGGALVEIASHTFNGSESSFTFSGISAAYKDLILVFSGRISDATERNVQVKINDLVGQINHRRYYNRGIDGGQNLEAAVNQINMPSCKGDSPYPSTFELLFPNYASGAPAKSFQYTGFQAGSGASYVMVGAGAVVSTPAISKLELTNAGPSNFRAGGIVTLYGRGGDAGAGGDEFQGSMLEAIQRKIIADAPVLSANQGWDFVLQKGDLVALYYTRYAVGAAYVNAATSYTVPAGKKAILIEAYATKNTRNDPSFYKHRLYNESISSVVMLASNVAGIAENGMVHNDTNTTVAPTFEPRFVAATAGQTLRAQAGGGSDSISRSVTCSYVLLIVDA
jgi:hypothetical protein